MTTIKIQLDESSLKRIENIEVMMQNIASKLNSSNDTPETDRFLKINDVENIIGFGRKWIYEEISTGNFPSPVKFGSASRWRLSEIKNWVNEH